MAYKDCYEALNAALEHPKGVKIPCETREAAERLRARMHYARKLDRDDNAAIYPETDHPLHGRSQYDILVVRVSMNGNRIWLRLEPNQSFADVIEPIDDDYQPLPPPPSEPIKPLTIQPVPFRRRV